MTKIVREMNEKEINEILYLTTDTILEKVKETVKETIKSNVSKKIIDILLNTRSIFGTGDGQSKLVMEAFLMRLTQLGFTCHIVGEPTTPAMSEDDCLVAVTGSGETGTKDRIKAAKDVGAKTIVITSNPNSTAGKLADVVVKIKGRELTLEKIGERIPDFAVRQLTGKNISELLPLGTLFEKATLTFLYALIAAIKEVTGQSEKDMQSRHANI